MCALHQAPASRRAHHITLIIQALLGHEHLSTTTRYAKVSTQLIASVQSPLDRLSLEKTPPR